MKKALKTLFQGKNTCEKKHKNTFKKTLWGLLFCITMITYRVNCHTRYMYFVTLKIYMAHEFLEIELKPVKCTPNIASKYVIFGRTPSIWRTDSPGYLWLEQMSHGHGSYHRTICRDFIMFVSSLYQNLVAVTLILPWTNWNRFCCTLDINVQYMYRKTCLWRTLKVRLESDRNRQLFSQQSVMSLGIHKKESDNCAKSNHMSCPPSRVSATSWFYSVIFQSENYNREC